MISTGKINKRNSRRALKDLRIIHICGKMCSVLENFDRFITSFNNIHKITTKILLQVFLPSWFLKSSINITGCAELDKRNWIKATCALKDYSINAYGLCKRIHHNPHNYTTKSQPHETYLYLGSEIWFLLFQLASWEGLLLASLPPLTLNPLPFFPAAVNPIFQNNY